MLESDKILYSFASEVRMSRKKYKLPFTYEEFSKEYLKILKDYLFDIVSDYEKEATEIKRLKESKLGLQNILNKTVPSGSISNYKAVQNELWAVTNFWRYSLVSQPISYTLKSSDDSDDITILNRYFTDVSKPKKDIETIADVVDTGIGYQFITPTTVKNIDTKYDSPFHLQHLDNEKTIVVYSSGILQEVLFSCVITDELSTEKNITEKQVTVYFPKKVVICKFGSEKIKSIVEKKQPFDFQPIIEFTLNPERMGVISVIEDLQDMQNDINSTQIDILKQQATPTLVICDADIQKKPGETLEQASLRMRKTATILLKSTNGITPTVKYLEQKTDTAGSTSTYDRIHKAIYDISSTPQASGGVTSGGDTGQARAFGNGWQNSFLTASGYKTYLASAQLEVLKNVLKSCELKGRKNLLKSTHASDIEITFNTDVFDSILIKAQAYANFINAGVPAEEAAKVTRVTTDPANWKEKADKLAKENEAKEKEIIDINPKTKEENNNDNVK